jgi:hypothetical protein
MLIPSFFFPYTFLTGIRFLTLNFHLLLHLPRCVRLYGPLWTVSCFPFETSNGFLVRCISGTNSSMVNMLVTATCHSNLRAIRAVVSPGASGFVQELLGDELPTNRAERKFGNATAVGPFQTGPKGRLVCFRAVVNGVLIESLGYTRNRERNNYTVKLRDGRFGIVHEFFGEHEGLQARVENLAMITNGQHSCSTISKLTKCDTQRVIPVSEILEGPLMTISFQGVLSIIQHRPSPDAS